MWGIGDVLCINGLGTVDVTRIFGSHNRAVLCVNDRTHDRVVKVFGESAEIDELGAEQLRSDILSYRNQLEMHGVPVPKANDVLIVIQRNGVTNRVNVVEVLPFYGECVEDELVTAEVSRCLALTQDLLQAIRDLLVESCDFRVGIDMVPRNFTVNGGLCYVDFMPPKIRSGENFSLEIPEVNDASCRQVGYFRHYTAVGVAKVLLVQLAKIRPTNINEFRHSIHSFFRQLGRQEVLGDWYRLEGNIQPNEIEALNFIDIYEIREIACQLCSRGRLTRNQLTKVFEQSHLQDEPLSDAVIGQIKCTLILACK